MSDKGMLVILSAPSGCGKDTVFQKIKDLRSDVVKSVSATTREPREGEIEGVNYFFKTEDEFRRMLNGGKLLEYTVYNGSYYGTPIEGVQEQIDNGKICFLIIEVEGGQNIMRLMPDSVSIFLLPPSVEVLEERLLNRSTESCDDIKNRLELSKYELEFADRYKYNIVNDNLEIAVSQINNILNKELEAHNR